MLNSHDERCRCPTWFMVSAYLLAFVGVCALAIIAYWALMLAVADSARAESGTASIYGINGPKDATQKLACSKKRLNIKALTAAHPSLPCGSLVKVTNPKNGLSVVVEINDRGPFVRGRIIDLTPAAAIQIGLTIRQGIMFVVLEVLYTPT